VDGVIQNGRKLAMGNEHVNDRMEEMMGRREERNWAKGQEQMRRSLENDGLYPLMICRTGCVKNRSTLKRYNFANFGAEASLKHDVNQN